MAMLKNIYGFLILMLNLKNEEWEIKDVNKITGFQ